MSATPSKGRQQALKRGKWSETRAAMALWLSGYKILARNHRTKLGEIDIIARKGDLVAMVEVKARAGEMQSVEAVGYHSQQRIKNAANLWLATQKDAASLSLRFDIVAVQPWKWPKHFEDAF